ncbi:MAG: conjugal transfer protein TrbL family protein [Bacilli bacterium]
MQVLGSILRFLFAWIDGIVAKVITLVYGLLMDLANLTLYSENIVKVIGQRIGILLGIFMLFRLSVSLINYMISPDKFSDSKQGGGALIRNVIISLVLLATVNIIFETAYSVQQKVVSSQIIEKIFFGETSQTKMDIGYYLYSGFFTPNPEVLSSCTNMWDPTKDLQRIPCDEYEDGKCPTDVKTCDSQLNEMIDDTGYKSVYDARNNLDMSKVFSDYDVVMANKGGAFKGQLLFNYTPIISTAAGVVALLIMISFSMELAKRAIKLLFLQIIAPVPIIFNMDTGKGKDVFQKWYKQCFNTYISVFIRLLAIDFAVFIIVLLKSEFSSVFQDKLGVNIFIIIGCLLFAKEVPKLIEDMTGIKSDGMLLRPLKKFEDQALFGKNITGFAAGAAVGAVGAATHGGAGRLFLDPFGRLMSGKGFTESWKTQVAANSRMRTARLNESTLGGRLNQRISNITGSGGELAAIEREKHAIQDQLDEIDRDIKIQEDAKNEIKGQATYRNRQHHMQQQKAIADIAGKMKERGITQVRNGEGVAGQKYQEMLRQVERLKHAEIGRNFTYTDENGVSIMTRFATEADAVEEAERIRQAAEHYAENNGWQNYTTEVSNGTHNDASMTSMQNQFDDAYRDVHGTILDHAATDYGTQLNGAFGTSKGEISRLQVEGADDERILSEYDRIISGLNGQKQPLNDQMRDLSRRESRVNANKNAIGK